MSKESAERIGDPWGRRTPFSPGQQWPSRQDVALAKDLVEDDVDRWVPSACVLCSNGCALDIAVRADQIVGVRGRRKDRVNRGQLGPKGLCGWQANNDADRLTRPLVRRGAQLEAASREAAPRRCRLQQDRTATRPCGARLTELAEGYRTPVTDSSDNPIGGDEDLDPETVLEDAPPVPMAVLRARRGCGPAVRVVGGLLARVGPPGFSATVRGVADVFDGLTADAARGTAGRDRGGCRW